MSIITFSNEDKKETGQTLTASAIASLLAIEHNYKILLMATDFNDETMENCFFSPIKKTNINLFNTTRNFSSMDISSGLEGLVRIFASNRASGQIINNYTKPILRDRLDVLLPPKTSDYKEYCNISNYFSQIADVANTVYDIVIVDMCKKIPGSNKNKILNLSDLVVMGITQSYRSINDFLELKLDNEFYTKSNVVLAVEKYNPNSKYTSKNIARYLKERIIPLSVPYNALFSDHCSDGKIIDYLLMTQKLNFEDGKDGFFYKQLKDSVERMDYKRKELQYQAK